MLILGMVWAKMKWIGPSSGSFLSPSTYVSMTVIKRNRGEENGEEAVERKEKEREKEADG